MPVAYWGIRSSAPTVWVPTVIPGLKAWYDASDTGSFTYSSGVLVSQWNDKSGTANHIFNTSPSNQPSRNGTQNSLTTVAFSSASFTSLAKTGATGLSGAGTTLFVVFTMNSTTSSYGTLVSMQPATGDVYSQAGGFLFLRNLGNNAIESYRTSADRSIKATTMNAWHQGTCLYDGTSNIVYVDGSAGSTVAYSPALAASRIFIGNSGGGEYFTGEIGEILVYDNALGSTDRGTVEAYLKAKWATP